MMYRCNVLVVDDEPLTRAFVSQIFETARYAVETFASAEGLLSRTNAHSRGCIVLDLKMPGMGGLELQKALSDRGIKLPVIFMSDEAKIWEVVAAMKQGAIDFLTKPIEPTELLGAVEIAANKDKEAALAEAVRERIRARWANLSTRERQVCDLVGQGLLIKQVAAELGTRESTVKIQRTSAFKKLEVDSVIELVRLLDRLREQR